jgi:hypothetical protein
MTDEKKPIIVVKVSAGARHLAGLLLRQTPGGNGVWKNCQFIVNQPVERCDWWVVFRPLGLLKPESTLCDPNHIVYISSEPNESVGNITESFLNQFSHFILCDRSIERPNIKYATGLTWWVGMRVRHVGGYHNFTPRYEMDYDILKAIQRPKKINRISVILSKKVFLEGHRKRLEFVSKIKELPVGKYIDLFGAGFNPIPDKWDVIAPYKYHLVLENDIVLDNWTEKLADAYLGFAFPIYSGCPNIHDYFPSESLLTIDINNLEATATRLLELIESDPYENHIAAISIARNKVLNQYNIFELMSDVCKGQASLSVECKLKPNYSAKYFIKSKIKQSIVNAVSSSKITLWGFKKIRQILG